MMRLYGDYSDFSQIDLKQSQSARVCYSKKIDLERPVDLDLNRELLEAGHYSTAGHHYVTLKLTTSRLHSLSVLHNHPYYVSDERSQRYTKIGSSNFYSFGDIKLKEHNIKSLGFYEDIFEELQEVLAPLCHERFKGRASAYLKKMSQELARMVLPLSVRTNIWHTVNLETLMRYVAFNPLKVRCHDDFVSKIFSKILVYSPTIEGHLKGLRGAHSISGNLFGTKPFTSSSISVSDEEHFLSSMEGLLGSQSLKSLFFTENSPPVIVHGTLNLSIAALAQFQRHRPFKTVINLSPDQYYMDSALKQCGSYLNWLRYIREIESKVSDSPLSYYFLPMGRMTTVDFSVDLSSLCNFMSKRLCYTAQREIFQSAYRIYEDLVDLYPKLGQLFCPPCHKRKFSGESPICPEGKRFCGQSVWNYPIATLAKERIL